MMMIMIMMMMQTVEYAGIHFDAIVFLKRMKSSCHNDDDDDDDNDDDYDNDDDHNLSIYSFQIKSVSQVGQTIVQDKIALVRHNLCGKHAHHDLKPRDSHMQ